MLADEMKHEIEDFQQDIPEILETSKEHTIAIDSENKS